MKKKHKICAVALLLSGVMFAQSMPMNLMTALAEELGEILRPEDVIEREFYSGNMVDSDNVGNGSIIRENIEKRTLSSKEFWMSDDTIMVQQFVEPIHYLENGEYKEIGETIVSKEKSLEEETNALGNEIEKDAVDIINIDEKGEIIIDSEEIYIGKKGGAEKSNAFLSFQLPTVAPYYQLLGATISFEYETSGMSLLNGKNLMCDVYVAESETDLQSILSSKEPKKIEELNKIEKTSQHISKVTTYKSDIINTNNLQSNTLTIGIETTEAMSEDSYIVLNTSSKSTYVQYWYKTTIGIKDEYSMESFDVNGAVSYVNAGTGKLTSVIELASVNTLSDIPFEASLIYNDDWDYVLEEIGKSSIVGNNVKLNFQQFMVAHDGVYELIDADGSISTFYPYANELYYSKDKKLYYNSSIGQVYDLQGNKMQFANGRLTQIYTDNNPTEYIKVIYASATSDQIVRVEYYADSTLKHTMSFGYSENRIATVTTSADSETPLKRALQYDEYGNLTGIKNQTGNAVGVQTVTLGYLDGSYNPIGMLNYVFGNQRKGVYFDRNHKDLIKAGRTVAAENNISAWRCSSWTTFEYYGNYTKIHYLENGVTTSSRYVSFNNVKEVISEWQEDSTGIVSVEASTNWKHLTSSSDLDYTKEVCTYYHKFSNGNSRGINANGGYFLSTIDNKSLEVENNENYTFAIIFKVSTGDSGTATQAGLKLNVEIGNEAQDIRLDYGGSTYIVIPCDYFPEPTNVKIVNNGTTNVIIDYLSYSLVNCVREAYTLDTGIGAHKLTSTSVSLRSGNYSHITYDAKQRVSQEETRSVGANALEEKTTYTYYGEENTTYYQRGKIKEIVTKEGEQETIKETTQYTYAGDWSDYTETATTIRGDNKVQCEYNITRGNGVGTVTERDENNISTRSYYKVLNGDIRLWKVEYGNTSEQYGYNNLGQITNIDVYEGSNGTPVFSQTDNYDENGIYLGSTYGGTTYAYGYDESGYVTSIGDGAVSPMLQYEYYSNSYTGDSSTPIYSNQLNRKTYANGNVEDYRYVALSTGSKTQVDYKNTLNGNVQGTYLYNYNKQGVMVSQSYQVNGTTKLVYDYGALDDLEKQTLGIGGLEFSLTYTNFYDTLNNRVKRSQIYSLITCFTINYRTIDYTYNDEGQISRLKYDLYEGNYSYDELGRLTNRNVPVLYSHLKLQDENYIYKTYGNGYTTNLLTCIDDQTDENNDRTATYDENGYVTSVSYNGNTYAYTYDGAGRLKSEKKNDVVVAEYEYDARNNIQKVKSGLIETEYNYDAKDRLIDEEDFEYDALCNPVLYKGNAFHWAQGRKLVSGTMNGNSFTYNYDGNGMRYEKTVNGTTTSYYWNGDELLMESKNEKRTWYIYGVTGIEGMIVEGGYNGGTYYYFDKNTLGDIVAIREASGTVLATYEYDAWGNYKVMDAYGRVNTSSSFIGNINPFRYRGYYYDVETGFYYLQTRYYDPTICRFINADNYELVATLSSVPGQLNMYTYCNNNPIMYTDPTGLWIETVFDIFSLGVSVVEVVINPANPWNWAGLVGDAVDLLPFVTGVGESVKAGKLVKYADDMYDAAHTTIRITKATDFSVDALQTVRTLDRVGEFTHSSLSAGRKIHKGYKFGLPGKEFNSVPGMRMDFFDGANIFELKPYNRNSLRSGVNQLLRYNNGLGGGYIMILELY